MNHRLYRCISRVASLALVTACWPQHPDTPLPVRRDSPLHVAVINARPSDLVVRADRPLRWVVVQVEPLVRLRVLYADWNPATSDANQSRDTLRLDRFAARAGRTLDPRAPGWAPPPCFDQSDESVCARLGAGSYTPQGSPVPHGYWVVIGAADPITPAGLERLLRTARPIGDPTAMASSLATALFGTRPPAWDYAVTTIPAWQDLRP
jgi:hypothetical protein